MADKNLLADKAVEILTQLQSAIQAGANIAMEQLPLIAREYVSYGIVSSIVWMIVGLLTIFIPIYMMRNYNDHSGVNPPKGFILMFPCGIGLLVFLIQLQCFLMVWFAPKVWLIKELAILVKY